MIKAGFTLDERLANDSTRLAEDDLCQLRLMHDARWPWLLLIPTVAGISEVFDLPPTQQHQLWQTSGQVAHTLKSVLQADKINLAALGNVVSQLHVHVIARFHDDPAWPAPVWGCTACTDRHYTTTTWNDRVIALAESSLRDYFRFDPETPEFLR